MPTDLEAITGIGPTTAKKLQDAGISSTEMLAYQVPGDLRIRGLKEDKLAEFIRLARDLLPFTKLRPATEIEEELNHTPQLTTGSPTLDNRLQGGLYAGSLVEFYGLSASGKSQWCHQLAVTSHLPQEQGGLESKVLWIDAEESFTPLTIRVMTKRFGLDPDSVLKNIDVICILHEEHMREFLDRLTTVCSEKEIGLVIVDSLGKLFAMELVGIASYDICRYHLIQTLERFRYIALTTGTTFVYTNRMHRSHSRDWQGMVTRPMNGKYMRHVADYIFKLKSTRWNKKELELEKHASIGSFDTKFVLDWGGFYHKDDPRTHGGFLEEYASNLLANRTSYRATNTRNTQ